MLWVYFLIPVGSLDYMFDMSLIKNYCAKGIAQINANAN
jgi:hypothetical protein